VLPDPRRASSTTGPVSGKTGKASMRRSTSRRTVVGSGLGSSLLRHAPPNSERTCAGRAAVPAPPTRRSTSLARSRLSGSLRSPRTRTTALTVIGMVPKVDRISALETTGREVVPALGSSLTYVSAPFLPLQPHFLR
jgi:hypothetical protein